MADMPLNVVRSYLCCVLKMEYKTNDRKFTLAFKKTVGDTRTHRNHIEMPERRSG